MYGRRNKMKIKETDLEKIKGGEVSLAVVLGVAALVVFISGIIDGYVHPKSCTN